MEVKLDESKPDTRREQIEARPRTRVVVAALLQTPVEHSPRKSVPERPLASTRCTSRRPRPIVFFSRHCTSLSTDLSLSLLSYILSLPHLLSREEEGRGIGIFTAHSTIHPFFHPNSFSNAHCNTVPPRWLAQASSTQLERHDVKQNRRSDV